jgi:hypothetical protein
MCAGHEDSGHKALEVEGPSPCRGEQGRLCPPVALTATSSPLVPLGRQDPGSWIERGSVQAPLLGAAEPPSWLLRDYSCTLGWCPVDAMAVAL